MVVGAKRKSEERSWSPRMAQRGFRTSQRLARMPDEVMEISKLLKRALPRAPDRAVIEAARFAQVLLASLIESHH